MNSYKTRKKAVGVKILEQDCVDLGPGSVIQPLSASVSSSVKHMKMMMINPMS